MSLFYLQGGQKLSLYFQSVDHGNRTRIVLLGSRGFQFKVKEEGKRLRIEVSPPAVKFERATRFSSSYVKAVNYGVAEKRGVIFVVMKTPFRLAGFHTLRAPFRLVIDLEREMLLKPGQTPVLPAKLVESLVQRYSLLQPESFSKDLSPVVRLLNMEAPLPSPVSFQQQVLMEQFDFIKNDIGLKIIGDYSYNTNLGIADVDEGPYKWRTRAGFDWDLLRDGLLKRAKEKELLKKELALEKLREKLSRREASYYYLRHLIIFLFSQKKIANLKQRKKILTELLRVIRTGYYMNRVLLEEAIKLERDLARVENLLDNYRKYREEFVSYAKLKGIDFSADDLPLVDVDIDRLLPELESPPGWQQLRKLNYERLRLKYNFWKDVRLKVWLYHYYYNRLTSRESFFSLGAQINIPFPFSLQERKELTEAQQKLFEAKYDRKIHAYVLEALNAYDELKYKLDDYINFYNKKRILKVRLERARIERKFGKAMMGDGVLLNILKQLLEVDFELYHIKQELYLRLIRIFRHYGGSIKPYLKPVTLKDITKEEIYKGDRSIFVWSHTFSTLDNDFLLEFLKVRKIGSVMLSFAEGVDLKKLNDFMDRAEREGIKVYALLSTQEWLEPSHRKSLRIKLEKLKAFPFRGVNLDVEPHLLRDWASKKQLYVSRYVSLVREVKASLPEGWQLQLSLPLGQLDLYREVFLLADEVFVMAYGNMQGKEKLIEERCNGPEKGPRFVITLRPSDFSSELEMEDFIDKLYEKGFRAFAFHDISKFLSEVK